MLKKSVFTRVKRFSFTLLRFEKHCFKRLVGFEYMIKGKEASGEKSF